MSKVARGMKWLGVFWLTCLVACTSPAASGPSKDFVARNGTHLLLNGEPYRFTGLNIYNANSINNCWYTLGTGSALDDSLTAIGSGQQVFRAWFFQHLATTDGHRDWTAFDHTLAVAQAHREKVIATLANQWGSCETDPAIYKTEAWYRSGYKTQIDPGSIRTYRDWVAEIVGRYRNSPTLAFWQLMNEAEAHTSNGGSCNGTATASLKAFAQDMASLVKSIDRNHLLSLGTSGSGCGTSGKSYQDVHSVAGIDLCEYHDYGSPSVPMPGDSLNGLRERIRQCHSLNKPLFVGETGILTSEVGSLFNRGAAWNAKFKAQFGAGVVGELIWAWRDAAHGGSALTDYDVGPGDPALLLLGLF